MADATCANCPWFSHDAAKSMDGYCHHASAFVEENSARQHDFFCSEHPLRQRDQLAAMAMGALIACPGTVGDPATLAECAYEYADAMLKERAKNGGRS